MNFRAISTRAFFAWSVFDVLKESIATQPEKVTRDRSVSGFAAFGSSMSVTPVAYVAESLAQPPTLGDDPRATAAAFVASKPFAEES